MARNVRLDHKGVSEIMKSAQMHKAVEDLAERVADNVRDMNLQTSDGDLPVTSKVVTTDRAHGLVALAHPAGEAIQAKYGALTKAAGQAGLEVKEKQ